MADRTVTVGRLAVSTPHQPGGAPLIDRGIMREPTSDRTWQTLVITPPWRTTRALAIGWEARHA